MNWAGEVVHVKVAAMESLDSEFAERPVHSRDFH